MTIETVSGLGAMLDDAARLIHLASMAVGFGTMVSTDIAALRRINRPIDPEYIRAIEAAHRIMAPALLMAWLSGVALMALRTGLDVTAMSPKLFAKLAVVTLLTLTALAIRRLVLPLLRLNRGRSLMEVPRGDKLILAFCAAMSVSGWGSALLLGGVTALKVAPFWLLATLLVAIYGTALTIAIGYANALHARLTGTGRTDPLRLAAATDRAMPAP